MGAFSDVLNYMDLFGQVPMNLLKGRGDEAGRALLDIFGQAIDAPLPGDWIPDAYQPEERLSGSELLGMESRGLTGTVADMAIETALNPLSYLSFPGSAAARGAKEASKARLLGAAKKAALHVDEATSVPARAAKLKKMAMEGDLEKAIDAAGDVAEHEVLAAQDPIGYFAGSRLPTRERVAKTLAPIGRKIPEPAKKFAKSFMDKAGFKARETFGALSPGRILEGIRVNAEALGTQSRQIGLRRVHQIAQGVTKEMDEAITAAMHNVNPTKRTLLTPAGSDLQTRIAAAAREYGVDQNKLASKVDELVKYTRDQADELLNEGVAAGTLPDEYMPRVFKGIKRTADDDDLIIKELGGETVLDSSRPGSLKKRVLRTDEDVARFLAENPDISLEQSAIKALKGRAAAQANLVTKAKVARGLLGESAVLSDATTRGAVNRIIDHMNDKDMGTVLKQLMGSAPPRGWFANVLAVNNRIFKPAATFGILLPRISFQVRNKLSSIWQRASVAEDGIQGAMSAFRSTPGDLYGAFADGLRSVGIGSQRAGNLAKQLQFLDDAMGRARNVTDLRQILKAEPKLLAAMDEGVLEGFVATENMLSSWMSKTPKGKKLVDILNAPAEVTQGLESRMRLGAFLDLLEKHGPKKAAQLTRESLLDYSMLRGGNAYGNLRQFIPFLAFTAQTVPQQMKFFTRRPAAAVALAQLYDQGDEPTLPWISERPHIKFGEDAEGNAAYLMSLGLPPESLDMIPNLSGGRFEIGRDVEQDVVGSAHPLLKAAYGYVSGREPFFGSRYGSYDKAPALFQALGMDERGGRVWNELAGTGVVQPVQSVIQTTNQALDERKTLSQRMINLLTGGRVVSNDPTRATVEMLQDKLERDPEAKAYLQYYGGSSDVEELIDELNKAKQRLRKQREAREMVSE